MAPEPKRRKVPLRTTSSPAEKKDTPATSINKSTVNVPQTRDIHPSIRQAQNYAVAQAQQDGCTGNFQIFDSPFGNFLVPVIPTRAELGG